MATRILKERSLPGYGAGTVSIWDQGTYDVDGSSAKDSEKTILEGIKKGVLHFSLNGKKLKGIFHLVRLKKSTKNQWLLIKKQGEKMTLQKEKKGTSKALLTHLDKIYWPKEKITKGDSSAIMMRFPVGFYRISKIVRNL